MLSSFIEKFKFVFLGDDRYKFLIEGFLNTLKITAGALVLGIIIGIVVAAVRTSYDKNKESMKLRGGAGLYILGFFNAICKVYLTVIRGTPVVVQLLIMYFVIFAER